MRILRVLVSFCFAAFTTAALGEDDFLDRLSEALSATAFHDNVRVRLSGAIDIEAYRIDQPPPGLIDTDRHFLFNPRLSLFLDAQFGPKIYAFAQARVDRGFDPSDRGAQMRLDEYALRITPWGDGRFTVQIGKSATVVGNWVNRHLSWDNPFITAPLPYENITAISDDKAPLSAQDFLARLGGPTYQHDPVIWGPSYTTGVSISGRRGKFDYAAEIKNAALSSQPESWAATDIGFDHPAFNARVGFRPNQMWNLGFSVSNGAYFRPEAAPTLPSGRGIGDYRELVLGQDISFAWHHVQVWAEFYEARFEVPRVGNADTFAYYIEAKYKFTPQLFGALRWNQQLFATIRDGGGGRAPWGHDLSRVDTAIGYRFTAHTQLKLQYSLQHEESGPRDFGHTVAAQFTLRF